jgi:hypothetical protein
VGVHLSMKIEFKRCANCNEAEYCGVNMFAGQMFTVQSVFEKTHFPAEFSIVFHLICCGMQILHILFYF